MISSQLGTAISSRSKVRFYYSLDKEPGFREVEPHMVAYNQAGNLALSAWYLSGASESKRGPGWREYLVSGISSMTISPETFPGPRDGYKADGGKTFHTIQFAIK